MSAVPVSFSFYGIMNCRLLVTENCLVYLFKCTFVLSIVKHLWFEHGRTRPIRGQTELRKSKMLNTP